MAASKRDIDTETESRLKIFGKAYTPEENFVNICVLPDGRIACSNYAEGICIIDPSRPKEKLLEIKTGIRNAFLYALTASEVLVMDERCLKPQFVLNIDTEERKKVDKEFSKPKIFTDKCVFAKLKSNEKEYLLVANLGMSLSNKIRIYDLHALDQPCLDEFTLPVSDLHLLYGMVALGDKLVLSVDNLYNHNPQLCTLSIKDKKLFLDQTYNIDSFKGSFVFANQNYLALMSAVDDKLTMNFGMLNKSEVTSKKQTFTSLHEESIDLNQFRIVDHSAQDQMEKRFFAIPETPLFCFVTPVKCELIIYNCVTNQKLKLELPKVFGSNLYVLPNGKILYITSWDGLLVMYERPSLIKELKESVKNLVGEAIRISPDVRDLIMKYIGTYDIAEPVLSKEAIQNIQNNLTLKLTDEKKS